MVGCAQAQQKSTSSLLFIPPSLDWLIARTLALQAHEATHAGSATILSPSFAVFHRLPPPPAHPIGLQQTKLRLMTSTQRPPPKKRDFHLPSRSTTDR